ncbi:hypothetical protein HCZ18_01480 [Limosilactobacillus fermentum]
MGNDLTRESQYLLYIMYSSYLQDRKSGKAIRAGENKFKNQLNAVADGLIKIKKIISPLS